MDPWDYKPTQDDHHNRRHPSFSSTLLDQIYRSIDDSSSDSMRKKQNRAGPLEESRPAVIAEDFVRSTNLKTVKPVFFKHSSSSSSDSSALSSSESDSFYKQSKSSHPKPIRTSVERSPPAIDTQQRSSFLRTKSKALKIYTDLKKVKQPISPAGRLATFLNSIFTGAGNNKKPSKINTAAASSTTTCSSASSFSRSCLTKTPSSSEKSKRSVRFCPVNVIFDEDSSKRCGHHNNKMYERKYESTRHHHHHYNNTNLDSSDVEIRVMEENRRVVEAAKELLRTYQKKNKDVVKEEEEEDDDDALSCASSDLFELDNLSAIGIERYREELPVYETTHFNTNRIISR